jgi:hypothetical protein
MFLVVWVVYPLGARIEDPTTFVRRLNSLLTALTEDEDPGIGQEGAGVETPDADDQAVIGTRQANDGADRGESD